MNLRSPAVRHVLKGVELQIKSRSLNCIQRTLLALFLLITVDSFSQVRDTSWSEKITLRSSDFIDSSKRIALFESDSFIIYTTLDLAVNNIRSFFDKYEIEEDKLLFDKLIDASKPIEITLMEIQSDIVLKSRLIFRISDLIQHENCLVYNKMSGDFETTLFETSYIINSRTGIRFSTPSKQQIIDLTTGYF